MKVTTYYRGPKIVLETSEEVGEVMRGRNLAKVREGELLQTRD